MKAFISLILSMAVFQAFSQEMSIERALESAQNSQQRQSVINYDIQNQNYIIQRRKRLPLIYGEGNIQRNLIIPVTPVPSIAFDPNAQPGEMTALRFATDWSSKAGVQFSWDIFNPQNTVNLKEAQYQVDKAEIEQNEATQNLKTSIIDLYAQGILAQKQLDEALIQLDNYESTYSVIEKRYEAGRASLIDLNTAKQKLIELNISVNEAEAVLKQKYQNLNRYVNMDGVVQLSSDFDAFEKVINIEKLDVKKQQLEIDLFDSKIDNIKYEYLPKVSLNAYYGTQFFNNEFKILNSENWYGNSFVNISLRLPITESLELKSKRKLLITQQKLAKERLEEIAENLQNDEQLQKSELNVLQQKIEAQKTLIQLANENLKLVKAQVEEGRILITELNLQVENVIKRNQQLWQLQYDYIRKKLE